MSLLHWVNDGLLTVFFLVVGLEIKREFTVGHLASRRSAALPIAGAIGGMVAPAVLYCAGHSAGPWAHGWGVPMATDTAFAVALIVMMGERVPVELRIFLTAAAIVDDIGAIVVVALFYSGDLHLALSRRRGRAHRRAGAAQPLPRLPRVALHAARRRALGLRSRGRPARHARRRDPGAVHPDAAAAEPQGADDAGRTRSWPPEARQRRRGAAPRAVDCPALRALDAIHDRLESPADRLLRHAGARSSYLVLPMFALANAGVVLIDATCWSAAQPLMLAIIAGLVLGKPLGLLAASRWRSGSGVARQAGRRTPGASWAAPARWPASASPCRCSSPARRSRSTPISPPPRSRVFAASILSAVIGVALLWSAGRAADDDRAATQPVTVGDAG